MTINNTVNIISMQGIMRKLLRKFLDHIKTILFFTPYILKCSSCSGFKQVYFKSPRVEYAFKILLAYDKCK